MSHHDTNFALRTSNTTLATLTLKTNGSMNAIYAIDTVWSLLTGWTRSTLHRFDIVDVVG